MASERQLRLAQLLAAGQDGVSAMVEAGWPLSTASWLGKDAEAYLAKAGVEIPRETAEEGPVAEPEPEPEPAVVPVAEPAQVVVPVIEPEAETDEAAPPELVAAALEVYEPAVMTGEDAAPVVAPVAEPVAHRRSGRPKKERSE